MNFKGFELISINFIFQNNIKDNCDLPFKGENTKSISATNNHGSMVIPLNPKKKILIWSEKEID